jgi:superoxide dismutase
MMELRLAGASFRTSASLPSGSRHPIEASFGTLDASRKEAATAATTRFGSDRSWTLLDAANDATGKVIQGPANSDLAEIDPA